MGLTPKRVGRQSNAPLTSIGTPQVPVILVQFADKSFSVAEDVKTVNEFYQKFLNGKGEGGHYTGAGSFGAVSEYFRDQSYGQFVPRFIPIGPVTLSRSYTYYGRNTSYQTDCNIDKFYSESIEKAQELGVDWNDFDNNGDGTIDMAFFIYAGVGENDSQSNDEYAIWPKENENGGIISGIRYGAYACCNELYQGVADGIGPMCHELSHALGLPDLYDTNLECFGLDYWDIMDSGCYCDGGYRPCGYSAYEKDFMGWRKLIELTPDSSQEITLCPMSSDEGYGYKVVNPENPDEYYVLENRQNIDWDKNIGYSSDVYGYFHGMLVTHIDYIPSRWANNTVNSNYYHQCCTLIPADGKLDTSMFAGTDEEIKNGEADYTISDYAMSMGGDPFPGQAYVRTDNHYSFQPLDSLAGAKAYVYTSTGLTPHQMGQPINDIEEHEDGTVTFVFCKTLADDIIPLHTPNLAVTTTYTLQGTPIADPATYRGIIIKNGKKYLKQ